MTAATMTAETITLVSCTCLTCGQELGDADCDAPCTNPACPRNAAPVLLSSCELHTLTTALGDYRDTLLRDLEREPDCRTYRCHLQETCSLLDRLADL